MKELLDYLERVVLPILDNQPPPRLGEWNWPQVARRLRELIAGAKDE